MNTDNPSATEERLNMLDLSAASVVTDEMVERALEAAKGRILDTRRHWSENDKAIVRAMLLAARSATRLTNEKVNDVESTEGVQAALRGYKDGHWTANDVVRRILLVAAERGTA